MAAANSPIGDQERELDDVLAKIDKALPKIHQRAQNAAEGTTSTQGFSPSRIKRTRMAFQAMCDDPLLSEDESVAALPPAPSPAVPPAAPTPCVPARQRAAINGSSKTT